MANMLLPLRLIGIRYGGESIGNDITIEVEAADPHRVHYPEARYAGTWFKIGHSGDRFLHMGRASLGCMTVTQRDRWGGLYAALVVVSSNTTGPALAANQAATGPTSPNWWGQGPPL